MPKPIGVVACNAIFLDHTHFSSARVEHEHSLGYDNRADEPAYQNFLSRLTTPLLTQLKLGEKVLVFGCGPSPAEAAMRSERGFSMALTIRFPSDKSSLKSIWDFITCTETAEHFHDPFSEFDRLYHLLKPPDHIGVMTCFATQGSDFRNWYYRINPTHVFLFVK